MTKGMKAITGFAVLATAIALVATGRSGAQAVPYKRVILVSWDGVRRDMLYDLLDADPAEPCWRDGDVFPVATGRLNASGQPGYTCLPTLAGLKPAGMPAESPAYASYQVLSMHTTNDGDTYTKPQHASMLTGYDVTTHGLEGNKSTGYVPQGSSIYERLMDYFDPVDPATLRRDGFVFRTQHSADKKFIGNSIVYWAKKSRALQVYTSHGSETPDRTGALKYVAISFAKWQADAVARGLDNDEMRFFMFLHFKNPDTTGHVAGDGSRQYREATMLADKRLYLLMEMLRAYGWEDTAILVATDHGFNGVYHSRTGGRTSINTWLAAYNVTLTTDGIPLRDAASYCAAQSDPADCLANGPHVPMPPEDAVPNVYVMSVLPTILDMYGVEWRDDPLISSPSLYQP
jgi:hypothetical protein